MPSDFIFLVFSFTPCFCWVQGLPVSCLNNYNILLICPSASNLALFQAITLTSTKKDFSQSRSCGEKSKFLLPSKMLAPLSPLLSSHTKLPTISLMHLDVSCFPAFTPAVPHACSSLPLAYLPNTCSVSRFNSSILPPHPGKLLWPARKGGHSILGSISVPCVKFYLIDSYNSPNSSL